MINSMTGFASAKGEFGAYSWAWELRSVNAKGLDLRLRVPDWLDGLETALRADLAKSVSRGNISLTLRVSRAEEAVGLVLNTSAVDAVLNAMATIESKAMDQGLSLAPSKASDLLALRGILDAGSNSDDVGPLVTRIKAEFGDLVQAFLQMRRDEGKALEIVLNSQLALIHDLTAQAAALAEDRKTATAENLKTNLARVLDNVTSADPDRVAQELAMIAVKADVTEEIDRLGAHVTAARDLLGKGGAVGRKLDFLMQEFNREANTVCSKSQFSALTTIGLELKAVIDQMREQVQNVE